MAAAAVGQPSLPLPPTAAAPSARQYRFKEGEELRFEVKTGKTVIVTLTEGAAEVFGTDLALGVRVPVTGLKLAVFTWYGCTVELDPNGLHFDEVLDSVYVADETPMNTYLGVHDALELRRKAARDSGGYGPRTVLVGPGDVGKSSLCRLLLNYAVRTGFAPTAVDLDIGQGSLSVPGCIGATPVELPLDIQEGLPAAVPLVFFLGEISAGENPALYRLLVERMAGLLDKRAESDAAVRAAGSVINTMGWVEGPGYELLLHAVRALRCDVVLALGQERLYNQLQTAFAGEPGVQVVRMPMSGGVVARDPATRRGARAARVREYFYGGDGSLSPASVTVPFQSLAIFKVGGGLRAPASALPIGATSRVDPLRIAPVQAVGELMNALLAVSYAEQPSELLAANTAGFLYVTRVDQLQQTVTYLAPCTGALPGKYLLLSNFRLFLE